ncbi:non-ribosomal peptide synthetase [Archangium lansingense]|uniref:Non-ribosomal peptide synthase/polyketide synthase n=1 Tax=Archangium lansingense TaxID=2995310 RepID=A0ABT4AAM6_9BACT|nr:non-ribosomal peptide synthetase [Archangium lansinium]MCY1078721.1 non-ribosomal peptide synthase/polyketide synthase [Archangium lansinium]
MSDTKRKLADLTPEQRALLMRQLKQKGAKSTSSHPPLTRRPQDGAPPPLSFSQQRLWFLDQLEPGSAAYNMPVALQLDGALRVDALERALTELVRRHESLRTTFQAHQDNPVQVISPPTPVVLPVTDVSSREDRAAEVRRRVEREAATGFDLVRGPLLRGSLLRLGERQHVLLLNMHHIVSDGWSMDVLVREVATLYAAFSAGQPSPLPELPAQYADYSVWQRSWLQGETLDAQLSWWRKQLEGAPAALELPTDFQRPSVQSFRGAAVPVRLSRPVSESLKALCQKEGVTPFMALLAAYQLLLSRYSGQDDITIGSPIAGRRMVELEGLIGFFVNTLALRTRLEGNPSFRQVLARVKETTLGAFAHQDIPFEKLVEELAPARTLGRSPLFQVMFALQNMPQQELQLPGFSLRPYPLDGVSARFDLELIISEGADGFSGELIYRSDLYSKATAEQLSRHFATLLEGLVSQPELPFHHLPLLSSEERQKVLVDWNHSPSSYPRDATINDVFERQVASTPDAIALEFGEQRLTYRQLDEASNRLAHVLRARGVGPDSRVALALDRSLELIISLLGILKAGGAYVPLDTSYPRERLSFMLEDAQPALLVTTREQLSRLPADGLPTLLIEESTEALAKAPSTAPRSGITPRNLAYIDFTSGSTGRPKGVCIEHSSVLRTVLDARYAEVSAQQSFLLIAPISFDASTLEVWGPLLNGGRLVVFPPHSPSDLQELAGVLQRHSVTTLHLTSGLFTQMVDGNLDGLRGVRQLLTGGDVVSSPHVRRVLEQLRIPVTACYGPTEGTLFTSCFRMTEPSQVPASVPIGTPISGTQVYLLDSHLQPVPPGTPGELFISGDGLARGYLQQPALTAERFLPNPFSSTPGSRLYRTGDLARHRADGVLEFLGRADFQVKIRGFRIELGEVEAALLSHPEVREAIVIAREDSPGNKRLVGYVTGKSDALDTLSLRSYLQQRLPEYMVPSALMALEALPLTPNGKVDRKALPAPEARPEFRPFVPPSTPTEVRLASLWCELLGLTQVSALDDFFELGGHSLLATRLVSRIRSTFEVELPLRALFEASTLSALSQRLDAALQAGQGVSLPPLTRAPRTDALPLSFAQQRLWFLDQLEPGSSAYNMPAALRLSGSLHVSSLQLSLSELLRRHESLRTTFKSVQDNPVQVISDVPVSLLQIVDLSGLPADSREAEAQRLAEQEARKAFDLANGPLLRATLVRMSDSEHVLLLTMHHIVSDGWSMGVLVREVAALYEAFSAGRPSPLPELPVQYADYAVWQRGWLQGEALDAQLSWWRKHLEGAPTALELPTDFQRPSVQSFRGAAVPVQLSRPVSEALKALCQKEGVTPFMALLAAYQLLLSRYSGQDDITVGSAIAGRRVAELEGLIGFFVNTLALRTRMEGNPSFRQVLARVKETTLGAFAHQDIPFEKLVEEVAPARTLGRSPLFQVMFALQNTPAPHLALPDLTIDSLSVEGTTARFELELNLAEAPEGFSGTLTYNQDLFSAATAEQLSRHFATLLEGLVSQPELPFHHLPLLSSEERQKVLVDWNHSPSSYPRDATINDVFERQVASTPDAIALEFGEQRLTYRQLDEASNRLAHVLRARGVGSDSRVALALDRSLELIISLLGILKAGGAYVPLDTSYPRERLSFMLEDAQPALLVTTREQLSRLPADGLPTLLIEESTEALAKAPSTAPRSGISPRNLAYIDFTSGSTGRPKGVCIEHSSVLRTVLDARYAEVSAQQSFLLIAPISFDASTLEVWGPLLNGGRLVVFPPHSPSDLQELAGVLQRHSVTTLHLTSGLFTQMVDGNLDGLRGVRQLLTGGDVVSSPHVRRVLEQLRIPVTACYGPTEGTLFTSCFRMTEPSQVPASVPIGTPISGTLVYLLDSHLQPVPPGTPGELFISGDGLARGYLQQPALTAERFLPNPFSSTPGSRLYRTGDLARHRADGVLEFLGRADFQVKIRGFRIELGEVEAALLSHPEVREAIVIAREDSPGNKRLVGYVTGKSDALDTLSLRAFLQQRLPEYMVPSALMALEALPLTPNGKVDRKALPAPEARPEFRPFVPPSTPTEVRLASLWCELLGLTQVSALDDFFELGGHSLLATRLVSRIRSTFEVELPLRALFEASTLSALSQRLDAALLAGQGVSLPPFTRAPRTDALPLSFAQQRLWFLDQLEPGSSAYNMPTALRLSGSLHVSSLQLSLSELVRRHESLRTTFKSVQDNPVQVISDVPVSLLQIVDLSGLPTDSREAEAQRLAEQEARKAFDLANGPLLRATLVRLSDSEHVLLLTMHHIVSDGWSMGVLVREVAALYEAFSTGRPSPLPELPVQYADYSVWQRGWLQGEALDAQLSWWRKHLEGAPTALELPTDFQRPSVQTFRGALVPVQLSRSVSDALKTLCQKEGVTPFMALLAAYQLLLSRYSGQDDITVGSAIAGRRVAELEGLIGFFVNTLALRTRMEGNPSFRQMLARVKETTLGAFAYQDIPFEKLVEKLAPVRTLGRTPLFQVMFALQNNAAPHLALPNLTIDSLPFESTTARFELELNLAEGPGGFSGVLIYNQDLFSAATAERLSRHFATLLEGLVSQPELPFHHLPLLSSEERQKVLVEWNHSPSSYPRDATIIDVFERQVASTPDAIALEFGEQRLSYRQLDEAANRLAHVLRARGVGPDSRVALALDRSLELIISLLGILKAGGAYVPLDTSYPRERLSFMLEDAQPALLVTTREQLSRLPADGLPTLLIEESTEALAKAPGTSPRSGITPRNLAYIDFTSGSTGRPKGVCIEHSSVLRTVLDARYAEVSAQQSFLLIAPISFDASTLEVWGPLLNGGRLVVFPPHSPSDLQELAGILQRHSVTTLHLTSGLFTQMVDGNLDGLRGVRQLLTGGDVVSSPHVRRVLEQLRIPVTACYGPTEGTLFTSCFRMTEPSHVSASVPIGTPISGTQVYLLDSHLQPVPPGTPGELFISGDGLARGYLQQPALTAERFLPNPFSSAPGSRLYRTGDLARHRSDGVLEFLGRADFQVKIRGFRIELGEVEAALLSHPEVREAIVIAREDSPGNKRLVGYVTGKSDALDTLSLRSYLQQRLPEYMVPSALMALEALPLTPNGKVDRKALPAPEARPEFRPFVPPSSPTEVRLASLWCELLGLTQVSALDDFFELGGHSLLATRLVSRIRSSFEVELPLRALFEASTLSALSQRLDAALLAGQGVSLPPLTRAPRTDALPLSFAQQRLWFLDQLEPGSSAYNMPAALRLSGSLHVSSLQRSLSELLRRHESLRTSFRDTDGQPTQLISPAEAFSLPVVDLSAHASQEAETRRLAEQDARAPFDLSRGPMLRATLVRLSDSEHVLLLNMHHIASDGWSMGVLVREVAALYEAFCAGRPSPLPELPVQYADYSVWQRSWLQGEALDAQLAWWRKHLEGAPAMLELPTDRPRPAARSYRGAVQMVTLSRELSESLRALGRREGVTPFMLLLAAFQVLLSRYSGQDDISVGSPIAGRRVAELEGLIGFFVNTLVLRTRLSGGSSFREVLARVKESTLGAFAHQDIPFEKLVEELSPERSLGHSPLFQVMFALANVPTGEFQLPGLTLRQEEQGSTTTKFDLSFTLGESPDGFGGTLTYNTDLFDAATAARMMRHFQVLLETIAARPDTALREIPLLTSEERQQVLVDWNDTRAEFPREATLHSLVQAQARRTPEATALVSESGSLTYRQLTEASTRLALHLRSLGVGPGTHVALCLERSLELLVSLLAIIEAGAAWVPLDPEYPSERLAFMLEDSGAKLLLTRSALLQALPSTQAQVLRLDSLDALNALPPPPQGTTLPQPEATRPAYVIYTSGSTGRPKGVQVAHRSAVNHLHWRQREYPMGPQDAFLQKASFSFDISVWEMFAPLLAGARLVLARPGGQRDPEYLVQTVIRHGITHLHFGPAPLSAFLQTTDIEGCQSLRFVFCGGEPLTHELHARFLSKLSAQLVHQYGPTEACIDCTAWVCPSHAVSTLPIGRPISNTQAYVVDASLQPVPVGVPGELLIGGEGVALGYLGRPELTSERFITDPFSTTPGARLYRTGDKVRWLADGTIEYLGRFDSQVKLRGFRIELGELESVLLQHASVRQAVALVREDAPGDRRLVAYVTGTLSDVSELRAFLQQRLPEYMVPSAIVHLETLPLNPNGKVERKALPVPEASALSRKVSRAPSTEAERALAAIWAEVLRVESVGAEEDFFSLGGHSLLATQVISRIRSSLGVELPLRTLFEAPTVAGLAERVQSASRTRAPALKPAARGGPLPLSFAQQRLWFLDQLEPGSTVYNMPSALRLSGRLSASALARALEALVLRHEALRTTFQAGEDGPVQVVSATPLSALHTVDLGALPGSEREAEVYRLAEEEARRPFDLTHGPLFRAALLRLSDTEHVLLLTLHHIVSDGWSNAILVRELAALYESFITGQQARLPALPVQYADYSVWQRDWLRGSVLQQQVDYWKQQLSGAPTALELPTDKPRPAMQSYRGASVPVHVSQALSESLKALCQKEGATPFMVLLAAFQVLLSRYSGQDDISVGSPIAGRTRAETEGLIGFFINTLVLRSHLSDGASFRELLSQVRTTTLAAYEHQDVPFEKLVEVLQPTRDLSRSALFQVMFILQNAPSGEFQLPGLTLRPVEHDGGATAKFELSLTLGEGPDGFGGALTYNTDLFEEATAARMMRQFQVLLEAIAAQPDTALRDLALIGKDEERLLLETWNPPGELPKDGSLLHTRLEAQARLTPSALAVADGTRSFTYDELMRRSNRLARHLRSLGVGPEVRVGVCLRRTVDLPVALLAVLKAGGTYAPLDPDYPSERLGYLLEDSCSALVISERSLLSALPQSRPQTLLLEELDAVLAAQSDEPLPASADAENLAYLIYTSGSTGRPKGVAITHRSAALFITWALEVFPPDELQGVLAATSVCFDLSIFELFVPLSCGGRVFVVPNALHLPSFSRRDEVTLVNTVPSAIAELVRTGGLPRSVRVVNLAGEALPKRTVDALYALGHLERVLNLYGPSEDTTYSTFDEVPRNELRGPTIGRPLENTQAYVLDRHLRLVPLGVPGELYLAGDGLARGYLLRPELTAERFLPDPYSRTPGGRMYKTGDLVRYLPDGRLDYLGRLDHQVKLRGFRIELGEVESVLARHPSVRQALALVREDSPGDKRLVAYVTGDSPDASTLRTYLLQHLPEYMVPSAFVPLEALPLTPNGKIDRKALPVPEASALSRKVSRAPSTETERALAAIWAEVLRVESVGAEEDFFSLGGHSLLATQVISRIRASLGVELPLRALFEAPTVASLAERVQTTSRVKAPALLAVRRDGPLPASFAQQRLWVLDQIEPGSAAYNIPTALRLSGRLSSDALARALEALVLRHEALRTTFQASEDGPVQVISATPLSSLHTVDLGALPESEREAEAYRLAQEEARRPFDLAHGPLFRTSLLRLSDTEHVLVLTLHHIISDGWSMGVLVRELAALYESFVTGQQARLPALPVQYADYSAWQRDWLRGAVLQQQVDYWKQQLSGAPSALELPTDKPRPAMQSYRGASVPVHVSQAVSESLKALCQKEGATPFMVLLAAFQVLLSRYSGQDDISVGSPIAGRTRAETEGLIGFFINTLVLRSHLSDGSSFRELLSQVRTTTLAAYEHQDVPFEKLVEVLQPTRDLSRSALFQVMFTLQNTPSGELQLPGLSLRPVEHEGTTAKFELSLTLGEGPDGFGGALTYNTDLFEEATAARMMRQFQVLLEAIAAQPDTALRDLALIGKDEERLLLETWNPPGELPKDGSLLHTRLEAQARLTPSALAVADGTRSFTYDELMRRSNRLARHLRSLGVGPEVRVGVCLRRTVDLPVALLAVLKAGGTYAPLDPDYPSERLGYLLEDSCSALVISERSLLSALPQSRPQTLLLEELDSVLAAQSDEPLPSSADAENLAYLIYTSGSTGRPKGVAITHRSAALFITWALEVFPPDELQGVLAATSVCFDLSIFELFVPLSCGGRVFVVPNALYLPSFSRRDEVTLVNTVPSAIAELVRTGGLPRSVRVVNLAGEALPKRTVDALYALGHVERVLNLYGPSEDTTYSTFDEVPRNELRGPTIGRPLENTQAYVLDRHLRLVPLGVPGELYLAGDGLARGYLLRPELTAERFLPDPYSRTPGGRMYKTGDLVRYLPDGRLDYLGRLDHQVKLRGFRIELGEVESVLARHPSVRQALALVREDSPGDKRLVAYVTGDSPDASTLRTYLLQHLPEYMVPSAFVPLEALPLTPNGKIDRKALPVPEASALSRKVSRAPSTETERILAAIWAEVLRVESVGAEEDFFSLGGHSLLATQVISRIRSSLGVELPLRALFEAPTVASLAERVQTTSRVKAPALLPVRRDGPLPASFAQQRLWVLDQIEPGSTAYNIPTALRLSGRLSSDALARALEALVLRHEALRTTFQAGKDGPVQVISATPLSALHTVDLGALPESEREAYRLAQEEAHRPFDLAHGPLFRTSLLRLSDTEHVLVLTLHHIVSDGWSMGVLVRELAALYESFVTGQQARLPALPVQYADYAVWQRDWLRGAVLQQQVDYWKQQLSGAPSALELPTDKPRPAMQSYRGANLPVHLPQALSESLKALCQKEGVTPFMVLLAAFQVLLSRYSGQDDISVGSPIAGRTRAETEGLIGFFINTLVLRSHLSDGSSFRELLSQVRTTTLAAYEHQDVPFEKLVEVLQPTRDLSRSALFQVMFTLQNTPSGELQLPGLTLSPVEQEGTTAKFELSLTLGEGPDGFGGALTYNTDLFEEATAARMMRHFQVLLEAIAAHPHTALRDLPLLTSEERQQVLLAWNDTRADFPRESTLHSLFQAQALRTPDAVALAFEDSTLTYRQLDESSTRLALHLRSLGSGPSVRIALCLERSLEMVVALLAILKSGASWVPVDPEYPADRQSFMLEDSGARLLLTRSTLLQALPSTQAQVVTLDSVEALESLPLPPQGTALPQAEANSPAYIIYTSGSTGRPKGVQVAHRSAVNHMLWLQSAFAVGPSDCVLHKTPLSFDASVWELWVPLLAGARMAIAPPGAHRDGAALVRSVLHHQATLLQLVPSLLRVLLQEPALSRATHLRSIFCGGEALPSELGHSLRSVLPSASLVNLYGPTEATIDATSHTYSPDDSGPTVPIGRPVTNTQVYVVDSALRPVPVGVPGELLIGGDSLALGYLGRPELTAERFITHPFSSSPGARLYRTGDKVRWLANGTLEYLGRFDHQVKLRGFRIELGEVESVLSRHPSVRQALALVREDSPGDKRLVAYVIGDSPDASTLRAYLLQHLPEYMVPSAFVPLEALPLSPNGKIDRKALPAPEASHQQLEQAFVPPRDALELEVARVFEEVLDLRPIGARGHFFELGGHSLLAVRLLAVLAERTQRRLPVSVLFQAPTVEQLAAALRTEAGPWSPLVPIQREGSRRPFFCVHPVGGNVLAYAELARQLGPDQPFYGLQSQGLDGVQPPLETVEEMAACYIEVIRTVQPQGPYLLGGWSMGSVVAFEMARQLQQRGERVELLALIDPSPARAALEESDEGAIPDTAALFARDLGRITGLQLPELPTDAGPEELLRAILEEGRKSGVLIPEAGLPELRVLLQVYSANMRALHRYTPERLDGRLAVLRAADSRDAPGEGRDRGWGDKGAEGVELQEVPGDHYGLLQPPHVQVLAERLKELLDRTQALDTGVPRAG